jgi:hypothetical protein
MVELVAKKMARSRESEGCGGDGERSGAVFLLTFKWNEKYGCGGGGGGGSESLREIVAKGLERFFLFGVNVQEHFLFANHKHERTIIATMGGVSSSKTLERFSTL